jgi:TolB protein
VIGSSHQRLTRFFEDGLPSWSPDAKTLVFLSRRHGDRQTRLYQVPSSGGGDWDMGGQVFGEYPTWLPDGRILFRATRPEHGLVAINADGSGSTMVFKDDTVTAPAASPDGKYVAFMSQKDGNWEIYRMQPDGSGVKRLTSNGARDGLPAWSPDSKTVAFVSDRNGAWAIWAMDIDGGNQRKLFVLPGSPDGFVRNEPDYSSRGWVEERVSWGR